MRIENLCFRHDSNTFTFGSNSIMKIKTKIFFLLFLVSAFVFQSYLSSAIKPYNGNSITDSKFSEPSQSPEEEEQENLISDNFLPNCQSVLSCKTGQHPTAQFVSGFVFKIKRAKFNSCFVKPMPNRLAFLCVYRL